MISWWNADGNALDSRSRSDGTLQNGAGFAAGRVGQAFSFNGANGVSVADTPSLDFGANADLSVEAWIRAADSTSIGDTSNSQPLRIGQHAMLPSFNFNGQIDELEIYNRALTGAEITSIFNAGLAGKLKTAVTPTGFSVLPETAAGSLISLIQNIEPTENIWSNVVVSPNNFQPNANADGSDSAPAVVSTIIGDAAITFPNVTTAGTTQVIPLDKNLFPALPSGTHTGLIYDAATSAAFTGNPTVCFNLPAFTAAQFAGLQIVHLENNLWRNRTAATNAFPTLCTAGLTSLSPLAIIVNSAPAAHSITPSTASVQTGGTVNFTVAGGIAPYGFSITANNSGAAINQTTGIYTAGTTGGNNSSPNFDGIIINQNSPNNRIGGTTAAARNVISGNEYSGISNFTTSDNTIIRGNYIGTNAAGNAALGNGGDGVYLISNNSIVGGLTATARNIISGSGRGGVRLEGANNRVQGNYIGRNADNSGDISNEIGIKVHNSSTAATSNFIGGIEAGAGNVIAGNFGQGVGMSTPLNARLINRNLVRANSIFGNCSTGISLNDLLANSSMPLAQDPDTGANNRQNYPVLTVVTSAAGNTVVSGTLNSTPSQTFTLDFYSNAACDASGFGEGETFLGAGNATTDAGGIVGFTANLPVATATGRFLTATATDADGNTSEFSQCRIAGAVHSIVGRITNGGTPLPNVEVRLTSSANPAFTSLTMTDSGGNYTLDFIPAGGNYTVTPTRANRVFSPSSRTYTNLGANQTNQNYATVPPPRHGIGGRVTTAALVPNIAPENNKKAGTNFMPPAPTGPFSLSGVTLTLSGGANIARINDNNGNYVFNNLVNGQDYTITPSKPNYTFTPPSVSFSTISGQPINFSGVSLGLSTLTGRIIYESSGGDIKAMNANGSGVFNVASPSKGIAFLSPDLSANGSRAVYVNRRTNGSQTRIVTINSDGSNSTNVLTNSGALSAPVFSPDNSRIAFHDAQKRLFVMNADGGGTTQINSNCTDPDWSSDNLKLICLSNQSGSSTLVRIINLSDSNAITTDNSAGLKFSPRWSPDGSVIAFIKRTISPTNHSIFLKQTDGSNSAAQTSRSTARRSRRQSRMPPEITVLRIFRQTAIIW